jgi:E3 ubiquitin-protein ligase UBR7
MNCHLDHASDVIELFHKRDFRCDCPTLKSSMKLLLGFKELIHLLVIDKCCFSEVVQVENRENKYQHNFEGLYCFCNKPYLESEEMIQCEICQDWFHDYCLKKEDTLVCF